MQSTIFPYASSALSPDTIHQSSQCISKKENYIAIFLSLIRDEKDTNLSIKALGISAHRHLHSSW